MSPDWTPSATRDALQARAEMLACIRSFFSARNVLEVETPLLGRHAGTDVHLAPMPVQFSATEQGWLQTSPEFAMKRLLAAGSGPVYQVCKAFRQHDNGSRHNHEFTILEWYRPGFILTQLMDEVFALVSGVCDLAAPVTLTYQEAFIKVLDIDPFSCSLEELKTRAYQLSGLRDDTEDRDFWLDLLFTHAVEQNLPPVCFLTDYPRSQAALARCEVNADGFEVARRFELIVNGVELANGYDELTDATEQRQRFAADLEKRHALGLPAIDVDEHLLAALEAGMPDCCGVALGLDRLLMLTLGVDSIDRVLGFDQARV